MRSNPAFDTDGELILQRHRNGIRLVKPSSRFMPSSTHTLGYLFKTPISVYFFDHENALVDGNELACEVTHSDSSRDMQGKKPLDYASKALADFVIKNNKKILQSGNMDVSSESGWNLYQSMIQAVSFKFPWYYENKIVGVFGCSILIHNTSVKNFAHQFSLLLSTGLVLPSQSPLKTFHNISFTARETSILKLLIRGKTAKEIGETLHLSPRTVEHYIANMKMKANCNSKSELIDKFIDEFHHV